MIDLHVGDRVHYSPSEDTLWMPPPDTEYTIFRITEEGYELRFWRNYRMARGDEAYLMIGDHPERLTLIDCPHVLLGVI